MSVLELTIQASHTLVGNLLPVSELCHPVRFFYDTAFRFIGNIVISCKLAL